MREKYGALEPLELVPGRYVGGPVRAFFSGDEERAQRAWLTALTQLGVMRQQLILGGDLIGSRKVTLPDGTVVETAWDGSLNLVYITAPVAEEEAAEDEEPYLSGLQEIAAIAAPLDGPFKLATQFYPAWQVLPLGRARQWYRYNLGFEPFDWAITPTDSATREDDPDVAFLYEWAVPTLPALDGGPLGLRAFPGWPGMYTGRMRYVVQKALGYKRRVSFSMNSGLWTPTGPQEHVDQRLRWVVEIDEIDGITAYPIPFVDELGSAGADVDESALSAEERERYDYAPLANFVAPTAVSDRVSDALAGTHRYRLAEASALADIVGKLPLTAWYPNWAFSYSGQEAQIVLMSTREVTPGSAVWYAERFKLSITEGSTADGDGFLRYPHSAEVRLIEGDYLYTSRFNYDLFAPITGPYQEQIYFETPGTPPEPRDAPIYVFYTRDDQEVVLRRADIADSFIDTEIKVGMDCDTTGCVIPCVYCDQPYHGTEPACEDPGCQRYYNSLAELCFQGYTEQLTGNAYTATYYCERTFAAERSFAGTVSGRYRHVDWEERETPAKNAVCNLLFYDYVVMTSVRESTGHQAIASPHAETRTSRTVVVLPLYDREGFYHLRVNGTEYSSAFGTEYQTVLIWRCNKLKGPYENMPEVGAVGQYAFAHGMWVTVDTDTSLPPNTVDLDYKYIGSVHPSHYGAADSVITLDSPPEGTTFGDGMTATAAVEMFSGRAILSPHPPLVDDGDGGERANTLITPADGESVYPVSESYRYAHTLNPKYYCFIGDGTTEPKAGMVDMNAIPYLADG